MFEFLELADSTVTGSVILGIVLAVMLFGNRLVDFLNSFRSSPIDDLEELIADQE